MLTWELGSGDFHVRTCTCSHAFPVVDTHVMQPSAAL